MASSVSLGEGCDIASGATVGHWYDSDTQPPVIGDEATIRTGTIVYDDVAIGNRFNTGHNAVIRELTEIGDDVLVGTNTVIDGRTSIGSGVSLQTGVYIPSHTTIGDDVFIGPHAVLTNDPLPIRADVDLVGPTIEDNVSIGGNATILPDVTIGEGSFVAAGAVVTTDVPPNTLAIGVPAVHKQLPPELDTPNQIR
ncbi:MULTISPECIES: acyltransferase [Haloferax]|uniref:N-acetyltransferase n=1 Tax=Haloferax marinum TaxID=2666143 RepID=A0A6A8G7M6_9EURY|nr:MULTISPECIES: acyltransferase [Haloferax]KAB1198203.1 N-acetyltransferase [Haloferax sp. CBA1150]MRW97290.1 N-acetyltransferase [Haloferax marinum]